MNKALKIVGLITIGVILFTVISGMITKMRYSNLPKSFSIVENGLYMNFFINDKGQFIMRADTDETIDEVPTVIKITRKQYAEYLAKAVASKNVEGVIVTGV